MINVPYTIQDAHGIQFSNGLVLISNIQLEQRSSHYSQLDLSDRQNIQRIENHHGANVQLSFNAVIFFDAQALANNKAALTLRNLDGNDWFTIQGLTEYPAVESLEQLCESFLLANVLPAMQVV